MEDNTQMQTGTVKWFNATKGFGFIAVEGAEKDLFVHINDIADGQPLNENERVTFEVAQGRKGPSAVNVTRSAE